MRKSVFIIAEAGVNHNNRFTFAKRMIDVAVKAGADAIKFQTFHADALVSRYAPKAHYQNTTTDKNETHWAMIKKLELSYADHVRLMAYCREKKIQFLSTPFDLPSIDLLHRLGLPMFKIPSGEITNLPYLRKIGRLRKKIILSTGMSTLSEIAKAVDVLVKSGTKLSCITVLQCNTEYPTPYRDANLKAMATIKKRLGVCVGYSDHTPGIEVPIAAVALGAEIIEKHFTLSRKMKGPDHKASLEPHELMAMVKAIRNVEQALGNGQKIVSFSEAKNKAIARKSIVANCRIKKGERFSMSNITVKRPGTGISPMHWDTVLGKIAKKNFQVDEIIKI